MRRSETYHVRYGWADVGDGNCGGDRTGDRVGEGGKCPGVGRIWRLATLVVD